MVSWVGLQCVIVVFPDHTHLLFIFWPWLSADGVGVQKCHILHAALYCVKGDFLTPNALTKY